jgi:hypothetical protein
MALMNVECKMYHNVTCNTNCRHSGVCCSKVPRYGFDRVVSPHLLRSKIDIADANVFPSSSLSNLDDISPKNEVRDYMAVLFANVVKKNTRSALLLLLLLLLFLLLYPTSTRKQSNAFSGTKLSRTQCHEQLSAFRPALPTHKNMTLLSLMREPASSFPPRTGNTLQWVFMGCEKRL